MRRIGLLGGMSWESSALYYRLLNEGVRDALGGVHSARILLSSLDFADIERLQAAGDWDAAGRLLAEEARRLEQAGAQVLGLCTNTMHIVAGAIEAATDLPFVHLGDATADAVRAAGVDTVGLLGTRFTMEQAFYRDRLSAAGLRVLVPEPPDREIVHRVIYDELVRGQVRAESREAYEAVIGRLVGSGAEGVVLGCTEIELLVDPDRCPVPVFPTTRIHVSALLAAALA